MGLHLGRQPSHPGKNTIVIDNQIFVKVINHKEHGFRMIIDTLETAGFPNVDRLEEWLPSNLHKFVTEKDKQILKQLLSHSDRFKKNEG